MAMSRPAGWLTNQRNEVITSLDAGSFRAWVIWSTGPVDRACGDRMQPNAWPLLAPDRSITVPDAHRRAQEGDTGRDGVVDHDLTRSRRERFEKRLLLMDLHEGRHQLPSYTHSAPKNVLDIHLEPTKTPETSRF